MLSWPQAVDTQQNDPSEIINFWSWELRARRWRVQDGSANNTDREHVFSTLVEWADEELLGCHGLGVEGDGVGVEEVTGGRCPETQP